MDAIEDQQLMFGQHGFCDDCALTSGSGKPENRRHEMDNENEQIAHDSSYRRQEPLIFRSN
jgi:hypothetical protein